MSYVTVFQNQTAHDLHINELFIIGNAQVMYLCGERSFRQPTTLHWQTGQH